VEIVVGSSKELIRHINRVIGERTRLARTKRQMTQTALAEEVGLTRSSIANIEAGRQHTPAHVVLLIARALDIPISELLPTYAELDDVARLQLPALDLEGQPGTTHDFVTAAMRRVTGG